MKYFSLFDVLRAILRSSLLGFIMGGIYNSLSTIIACTCKLFGVGVYAIRSSSLSDWHKAFKPQEWRSSSKNAYDFVFFACFGVMHIMLCYLSMDGVLRLYILIPSVITFFVSKNTVGAIFKKVIIGIYTLVYRILFFLLYVLTYPLRILGCAIITLFSPLLKRIIYIIHKTNKKLLMRKKERQIVSYFKSATKI